MAKPMLIAILFVSSVRLPDGESNLVPETPSTAPDYFCTWNLQGFVCSYSDANAQADAMTEANLFGAGPNQNWVEFYPQVRGDLTLVLDDTWDMPLGGGRGHPMRGSLELDAQRFPSYTGTPAERLAKLTRDVRARGWRGLGLWILSCRAKARRDPRVNDEQYWSERLLWCKEAGIDYWKVDWGAFGEMDLWRLNQWARRANPAVWIEHGGFNPEGNRIWCADKIGVWRTYDVNPMSAIPVTISRIAGMLGHPRQDRTSAGLINCEDEPYIGAGLGCVYGVMRHPLLGNMPNGQPDRWFRKEARDLKRRLDEVTRAVRWHRIAHPFGVTEKEAVDPQVFRDKPTSPGAPARIARGGLPLPAVAVPEGKEAPYVLCSRHPAGEIAVATIARKTRAGEFINPADISLEVGELNRPVGIFGEYASLTLVTAGALAGRRILAQDLAGKTPVDITAEVKVDGGRLTLPGAVIHRVGLMAARPGDLSEPGLVLAVEGLTTFVPKKPMTPHDFEAVPLRPLPAAEPGGPLKVHHALWGPVYGGREVTTLLAGMVKDGGLKVDAIPEVLGEDGADQVHQRLEVEYTCNGRAGVALAVYGDILTLRPDGTWRTDRVNRPPPPANEKGGARTGPTGTGEKNQESGGAAPSDPDFAAMIRPIPDSAKFSDPDFYIWCGTMVRGDDGRYHLYYSRWPRRLGHNAWVTHSEVAHAMGDTALGPFTHRDVALPARGKEFWDGLCTHNPNVHRFGSKYYLYYMGNTGNGEATKTLNWTHRNNQRVGVAMADAPEGPWRRMDKPLIEPTPGFVDALCATNPTVTERPGGGYLMIYKAVGDRDKPPFGGPVLHAVATSDAPTGPFRKHPHPVFVKEGVAFATEDPFLWSDGRRYWAIVKDNAGHFTGRGKSTALFQSEDGLEWKLAKHALVATTAVRWEDGRSQKLHSLERPQLFFEDGRPAVLMFAADEDARREHSFNVRIPLGPAR